MEMIAALSCLDYLISLIKFTLIDSLHNGIGSDDRRSGFQLMNENRKTRVRKKEKKYNRNFALQIIYNAQILKTQEKMLTDFNNEHIIPVC